jgi:hypothetical protein
MPACLFRNRLDPSVNTSTDIPVSVPAGSLAHGGLIPTLARGLMLPAGSLVHAGFAPTVPRLLSVPKGTLTHTGRVPTPVNSGAGLSISGVSGTKTHGSSVTITGSGFGTKPSQTPWQWDDMNGTDGDLLEPRGWLVANNGASPVPALSDAVVRSTPSRTTSALLSQRNGSVPGFSFGDNGKDGGVEYLTLTSASAANRRVPPTGPLLVSWWMYVNQSTTTNNYKFARWHSYEFPATSGNEFWAFSGGNSGMGAMMNNGLAPESSDLDGTWSHITLLMDWKDDDTFVKFYVWQGAGSTMDVQGEMVDTDPPGVGDHSATAGWFFGTDATWHTLANGTDRISTFQFEHQDGTTGSPSRDGEYYLADILVDDKYNRVYLGNASTFATCNHVEIQPYTAWADGSVTITLNRGTFGASDTVYVYVMDEADVASTGFQITLGS